ncbi:MAG: META domain-containing protein, partial [Planctomycetota bacterium]
MRKHVLSIGMALMLGILTLAACGPAANDNPDVAGLPTVGQIQDGQNEIPTSEIMTKEEGQAIAIEFVKNSPTFQFDGIEETLALVDSIEVSMPGAWSYEVSFESRQTGYGERTGQMLDQVITSHLVFVSVEQGKVVYASMDNKWDMLSQEEISYSDEPVQNIENIALENMSWILVSFERQGEHIPMPDGAEVTLFFDKSEGLARGRSGCNSYGGAYRIDGNNLMIPEVEYTEMACLDPEGIMELEQEYLRS